MNAASYATMSHEELVQEACRLQQSVRVLVRLFRACCQQILIVPCCRPLQLDKEKKVSAAYAEELKRTREQAMAVVSRQQPSKQHLADALPGT
jgi:hypothetical protein